MIQTMQVASCGCAAAVGVMSVVVDVSNLGEGPLGVNSAPTAGEQAAEPPPPAAAELSSPAVQLTYVASYDVDLDQAFLTENPLFPKLADVELDQEGATWKHDGHEDRWARLVDQNMHLPGLTTAFADVAAFKLVTDRMRQASSGQTLVFVMRHGYEGVDFEREMAKITQDNIMFNTRMNYKQDDGYDAGGLSRQGAYTLTLTLTHSHTHSGGWTAFEELSDVFRDNFMDDGLFKTVDKRGRAGQGEVVAKSILLAVFNGHILPYLQMPQYLWCRAFDKMYDWYADDNIFAEVSAFMPQHLTHKLKLVRYGHASNPTRKEGSVGWDTWAFDMQGRQFDETVDDTPTVLGHFNMLYPCSECGNMDAGEDCHGGDLSTVCGCGIQVANAPTGSDRQITNLAELHHSILAYMDTRTVKGRPRAVDVVNSVQQLVMRTEGVAYTHGWSGIMKHVFTKMSLAHLIRSITGGERKLELDVNVHVKTRFVGNRARDPDLAGTVWSMRNARSTKLMVQEAFEEFWNSITGADNQHLFLKLITGGSFAGPAGTTITLGYKSYRHYSNTKKDVEALDTYAKDVCSSKDREIAYL